MDKGNQTPSTSTKSTQTISYYVQHGQEWTNPKKEGQTKGMGKGNQKPLTSTKYTQTISYYIQHGQKWTNPENEGQAKVENDDKTLSIHDLPPEMLLKIFKMMDIKNLITCRLVNRKWNELVVQTFQSRSDLEILLDCHAKGEQSSGLWTRVKRVNLPDYLACFGHGRDNREIFPFTQFYCFLQTSTFDDKNWLKFLSDFGENIKRLKLRIRYIAQNETMMQVSEKLRNLLVNQLPKLQEFGLFLDVPRSLIYSESIPPTENPESTIQLFPSKVRLEHLKVVYLAEESFSEYTGIVTDLLEAAVNLQEIRLLHRTHFVLKIPHFEFLRPLGKVHCLKDVEMDLSLDFLSRVKENAPSMSKLSLTAPPSQEFKVKVLYLYMWEVYRTYGAWKDASLFLYKLFESNQDTLKEMRICSLGFLHGLRLPKFSKLTTLAIRMQYYGIQILEPILPPGMKFADVFPVLRSLDLVIPWTTAFSNADTISAVPTLESLKVIADSMDENTIAQIGFMCPNLKDFETNEYQGKSVQNFPEMGSAIWTHLTKLQSLKMRIGIENPANAFPAIDSCVTGFSGEYCIHLYNMKESGSKLNIPQPELEAERKNPSILSLKDLKNLKIDLVFEKKEYQYSYEDGELVRDFEDEEKYKADLKEKALTFISKEYAFKLMDGLIYNRKEEFSCVNQIDLIRTVAVPVGKK